MRIALFGNALSTMVRFRGSLICELKERGHDVLAICPDGSPEDRSSLTALGARHVPLFRFSRAGLNPIGEMSLLQELIGILRRERPDALFSYFLKPVIWGSIAAHMAGVPRSVGMIEGMGATFSRPSGCALTRARQRAVRSATLFLLRQALVRLDHLIVLNPDDAAMIRQLEYIAPERMTCIDGIGIDLSEYGAAPPVTQPIRFAMVSRLLREKGVEQFAAAAEAVRARSPQVRFSLIGGLDDARGALDARQIRDWVARGLIDWHGHVSDVRPNSSQSRASCFCRPCIARGCPGRSWRPWQWPAPSSRPTCPAPGIRSPTV